MRGLSRLSGVKRGPKLECQRASCCHSRLGKRIYGHVEVIHVTHPSPERARINQAHLISIPDDHAAVRSTRRMSVADNSQLGVGRLHVINDPPQRINTPLDPRFKEDFASIGHYLNSLDEVPITRSKRVDGSERSTQPLPAATLKKRPSTVHGAWEQPRRLPVVRDKHQRHDPEVYQRIATDRKTFAELREAHRAKKASEALEESKLQVETEVEMNGEVQQKSVIPPVPDTASVPATNTEASRPGPGIPSTQNSQPELQVPDSESDELYRGSVIAGNPTPNHTTNKQRRRFSSRSWRRYRTKVSDSLRRFWDGTKRIARDYWSNS